MKQPIDTDIDICFDGIRAYFVSGAKVVSDLHIYKSHRAAVARIAELEARIAELEATQPLPEWTGKRLVAIGDNRGVTAHTFNGASHIDTYHDVMTSGRIP